MELIIKKVIIYIFVTLGFLLVSIGTDISDNFWIHFALVVLGVGLVINCLSFYNQRLVLRKVICTNCEMEFKYRSDKFPTPKLCPMCGSKKIKVMQK